MLPWQLLGSVFGTAAGGLREYFSKKGDIAERKAVARIETVSKGIPGYSDEYLILVWSYPAVASFIPILQPSVSAGLAHFNQLPDWYIASFITITFAVFGIDKFFRWKL